MAGKKKIQVRAIVVDIRSGMTNDQLMAKYDLSARGLSSVYTKLVHAGAMHEDELKRRMPPGDDTADIDQMREVARCYPVVHIPIVDLTDLRNEGYVRDVTRKGIQLGGITAEPAEKKTFLIQPNSVSEVTPFTFEAECRWIRDDQPDGLIVSGFEISEISEAHLHQLQEMIHLVALCDLGKK
jgi:hypothetical protein